jgi:hypothetical protein
LTTRNIPFFLSFIAAAVTLCPAAAIKIPAALPVKPVNAAGIFIVGKGVTSVREIENILVFLLEDPEHCLGYGFIFDTHEAVAFLVVVRSLFQLENDHFVLFLIGGDQYNVFVALILDGIEIFKGSLVALIVTEIDQIVLFFFVKDILGFVTHD